MKDIPGKPTSDYEIGYGKPPMHTRFKKGERRPRKSKRGESMISIFKRVCRETVYLNEGNDRPKLKMTRGQAVLAMNNRLALKKNKAALRNMFLLAEQNALLLYETDPKQVGGLVAIPTPPSSREEWLEGVREREECRAMERELDALRAKYGVEKPFFDALAEYARHLKLAAKK